MLKSKTELAILAITHYLKNHSLLLVKPNQISGDLTSPVPCFVTVYVNGQLRGCVGDYQTRNPLYQNIIKNAVNAAFFDSRFFPISENDLPGLKVEVSCLTPPKKISPVNTSRLLKYLQKNKPGLLISAGLCRALFLPQVWDSLPKPEDFLSRLCIKAGLPENFWQTPGQLDYREFKIF